VRGVYSEVNDIFAQGEQSPFAAKYADVLPTLRDMHDLYAILAARSAARGALALETAEAQILLNEDGEPVIIEGGRTDGERWFKLTTSQSNGWLRINYIWENGLSEELFEKDRG